VATLMVTHDLLGVADVADRIGFIGAGRVHEEVAAQAGARNTPRFDVLGLHQRYAAGVGS
jgi:ABC-2 type transport system ATP-binding protein